MTYNSATLSCPSHILIQYLGPDASNRVLSTRWVWSYLLRVWSRRVGWCSSRDDRCCCCWERDGGYWLLLCSGHRNICRLHRENTHRIHTWNNHSLHGYSNYWLTRLMRVFKRGHPQRIIIQNHTSHLIQVVWQISPSWQPMGLSMNMNWDYTQLTYKSSFTRIQKIKTAANSVIIQIHHALSINEETLLYINMITILKNLHHFNKPQRSPTLNEATNSHTSNWLNNRKIETWHVKLLTDESRYAYRDQLWTEIMIISI